MSMCKRCGKLSHGGSCTPWRRAWVPKPKRESRVEWFGSLQVHQPVKP